jgi:hypothetical protein
MVTTATKLKPASEFLDRFSKSIVSFIVFSCKLQVTSFVTVVTIALHKMRNIL